MTFQWKYFEQAELTIDGQPSVLNIGAADDPLKFGDKAMHFDIDDWSYTHKFFTQGDAHYLPFPDQSYDVVIMGDIHEHLRNPFNATLEAARVTRRLLVMTIFEEWRLPGPGQHIQGGHELGDRVSRELGYADRQDYQVKVFPKRIGYDDDAETHLVHVWQFVDADIDKIVNGVELVGFHTKEFVKAYEATHEGHRWYNWLICLERRQ
jgi:hypothetical protein